MGKKYVLFATALMLCSAFLCCSAFSDDSEAAPPVDRTVIIGSEDCPLTYYYDTPSLKTTYHVYLAAGSFLSIKHSTMGTPKAVSGTSDVSVETYTMSNGVSTKKVEGTVSTIGTFTISSSRAALQSYDPGDFIIHVVQPKSLMLDPGEPFSMTLVSFDPAASTSATGFLGFPDGPDWITVVFDGATETLSGTAPSSPGTYTESFYTSSNKEYKCASIDITVRENPKYTVTYNANGGSCPSSSATVEKGTPAVLPTPSKANSTFAGWFTAASGGTRVGGAGDSYSPQENTTLFAQWKENTLSIGTVETQYSVTGKSVSFSVTSDSDPAVAVSYRVNGGTDVNIPGGSNGTMNVKITGSTVTCSSVTAGTYQFTLTASANNYPSSSTTVTVQFAPILQFTNTPTAGALNG